MTVFRPGVLPNDPAKPRLRLGPRLTGPVTPPTSANWDRAVRSWPMDANDAYGCCLVEGTPVQADGVRRAYRVRYDGPVLLLEFASGRVLTVTPNHAVLTPRGFVRARLLQKGDDAVRACRPQMLKGGTHFDQAPAPIEEVFAALGRRGTITRQRAQSRFAAGPDDFHGDARFFDGDVEVVDALSLLERQHDAPLSKPYGKREVCAAGELERDLHRPRPAFQTSGVGGTSALGGVGRSCDRSAFRDRHPGVAHAEGLTLGSHRSAGLNEEAAESRLAHASLRGEVDPAFPGVVAVEERRQCWLDVGVTTSESGSDALQARRELVASALHPSLDGGPTDAELAGDLLEGFPGLVEADHLVDIQEQRYHGYVYDLSTDRRWYVANEILVHNCVWAMIGHTIQTWTANAATEVDVPVSALLKGYSDVTGFRPDDPGTDNGTVMQDAFNYWRKTGIASHKILAFAQVDHTSLVELEAAAALFGEVLLAIDLPDTAMDQFDADQPWDVVAGAHSEGGHAICSARYDTTQPAPWTVITWGREQSVTTRFLAKYLSEAWVAVAPEWIAANGTSPSGLDLHGLGEDFAALTGQPNPFDTPPGPPDPLPSSLDVAVQALIEDPVVASWVRHVHVVGTTRHVAELVADILTAAKDAA